ncbi:hypothetical protein [Pseudobacillus badius]|nr:hypothetical protein [Bacillus badius]
MQLQEMLAMNRTAKIMKGHVRSLLAFSCHANNLIIRTILDDHQIILLEE